jgi:hypothetical protein
MDVSDWSQEDTGRGERAVSLQGVPALARCVLADGGCGLAQYQKEAKFVRDYRRESGHGR